ncbi:MAG: mechanosensitive ion channel family protein [Desulfobacteraceae bacterium]|jgi:MscS family membrane protein
MNTSAKQLIWTAVITACIWVLLGLGAAMAQDQASPPLKTAEEAAPADEKAPAEPLRPVNTEGIDEAGKKVGKGVERFSKMVAVYLGDWVNQTVMAGISWMKLLFCCILLLGVITLERLLRWSLNYKINAIPHQEGVISWLRLFLRAVVKPLSLFIYVYGIYAALSPLYEHFEAADGTNLILLVAKRAADIGGTVALFWFFFLLVTVLDARLMKWAEGTQSSIDNVLVPLIGKTLRIFIVIVGGMMVLQNLTGVQIGPLLASLGIGGLAVALAAKDSIANFFGTLTILFDKPFQVGDRIVINNYDGSVEHVGFRSTRIRLLNGHLVSIPNEKVVNSEVENIGQRPNIRWLSQIGITYDTSAEKVQEAVSILREILQDHEGMHPDFPPRVYFNGFNDWSLNITVVLWYHPPEWWDFQAWLQQTCLEILRRFESAGIDFAFPSRTLYLANDDKRQLKLQMIEGESVETNI